MQATNGKQRRAVDPYDRQPPHDLRAEIGLVGSLFLVAEKFPEAAMIVRFEDFYDDANAKIYSAMAALHSAGKPLDLTLLVDRLRAAGNLEAIGGHAYLSKVVNAVPNAANLFWYAGIVAEKATKRRAIMGLTEILAECYDDRGEADEIVVAVEALGVKLSSRSTSTYQIASLADAAGKVVSGLRQPEQASGVNRASWGIVSIDEDLGPIMPGEVCVIAARPGLGKTSLAQQILRNSAMRDRPALIVSLEMTDAEVAGRELCRVTGIDSRAIRSGEVEPLELDKLESAAKDFSGVPLYIWSPARATLSQIRGVAANAVSRLGVRLLAIDYLQLVEGEERSRDDRRAQLVQVSRGLKRMAKEFSLPVLALSQINREGEKDNKEPTLGMLRECGAIEEDADFVVFLHCEDPKADNTRTFIAKKVRGAPKGKRTLKWDGARTEFSDLEARDHPNYEQRFDAWNNQ